MTCYCQSSNLYGVMSCRIKHGLLASIPWPNRDSIMSVINVSGYLPISVNKTRIWKRNMLNNQHIQYRHLIPAPVDRTSASFWLYKHPWVSCQNISQTHQYDPYILFFFQILFYFPPSNRHVNKQGTKD